jgi:hypothetical protein
MAIFAIARLRHGNAAEVDIEKLKAELQAQIEAQTSAIKAAVTLSSDRKRIKLLRSNQEQ